LSKLTDGLLRHDAPRNDETLYIRLGLYFQKHINHPLRALNFSQHTQIISLESHKRLDQLIP
jgi:hypothetical protein